MFLCLVQFSSRDTLSAKTRSIDQLYSLLTIGELVTRGVERVIVVGLDRSGEHSDHRSQVSVSGMTLLLLFFRVRHKKKDALLLEAHLIMLKWPQMPTKKSSVLV